jgi:glutamine synthetase
VAETLKQFKKSVDAIIEKGEKKEIAIMQVIQQNISSSEKVLFEGDGYSDEWHQEAEKRGLPNVRTTPAALDAYLSQASKHLFEVNGIYNHAELEARHEILLEDYIKKVQIESRIMGELCTSHILPSAIKYQNVLINNIKGLKEVGLKPASYANQLQILERISEHISNVADKVEQMIEARKKANGVADSRSRAVAYCDEVKGKFFDDIRYHVDKLEMLVDDQYWLLPKYREMLFLR